MKQPKRLKRTSHDQAAYSVHAIEIATELDEMVSDASGDTDDTEKLQERHSVVLPPDWDDSDLDSEIESVGAGVSTNVDTAAEALDRLGDYHIFTTEYDQYVEASSLLRPEKRYSLRADLDQLVKAQSVSVTRLAAELQQLFAVPERDGWLFGQDEGLIDARRLTQLVSNPEYRQIFVQDRMQLKSHAVVSFLVDNSGSMKRQRYQAVAVLLDTFCRALGLANIESEVLGFTTADWNGGRAQTAWRKAGQAEHPGRLGELLHVTYKSADSSWRRSRGDMACLLSTQHFREGVDGEALIWAYQRLRQRDQQQRYLVVISDGAPLDAATHNANRDGFLADHLASVANVIDRDPTVQLGAIGIDLDMSDSFKHSVALDLGGTLGTASYRVLHDLFGANTGQ